MSASGYTAWSVTAGEIPTTAYWNILGSNDASFNNGNGINDSAIVTRHIAPHNVTNITYVYNETPATASTNAGTTFTDVGGWTTGTFTTSGGDVILNVNFACWMSAAALGSEFRVQINGSTNYPSNSGWHFFWNVGGTHWPFSRTLWLTSLPASTYTVKLQAKASTSGTVNFDPNDSMNMVAVEYLK